MSYLILIGSVGGYFAYNWLLSNQSVEIASSFAYVNPVVALVFGVVFFSESFTWTQLLSVIPITGSVMLLLTNRIVRPKRLVSG